MILHHYENSPYAEKIRLMFGLTGSSWDSVLSPPWPPRPNVDPLSGGYRRIPIAQEGADIFCDSSLIASEIAASTDTPSLNPSSVDGTALELMEKAERQAFFAAITALPPRKLLATMLRNFGPMGTFRFVKDRTGILKGGTQKTMSPEDSLRVLEELFNTLDHWLMENDWIGGSTASVADLAVYHPIWLHLNCGGKLPAAALHIGPWFQKVEELGHGERKDITPADAFASAKNSEPRELPESVDAEHLGNNVQIAPTDYGVVPVAGKLVAATSDRLILARESTDFGLVHVHFPREGYAVTPTA
ncbi:MAG: glutathione S-transferase family protein [Pseudomonadota bacterium]